jgi:signal transduction histidine kinase
LQESILYVEDLSELQNNPALAASIRDEAFFCYFGIPLLAKGQLLGVMEIFCREPYNPSPQWLTFLDTLARQAAMSIDNANLLRLTRQRLQEVNALYRISKGLIAVTEPQKLMDDVVELLKESFGYYYVQIFVVEPSSGDFVMRAGSGEIGAQMRAEGYRLRPGEGIVGLTADTGEPFFSNDVERVITFVRPPHLAETNAELAVPIQVGKSFLGLLDVHQKHPAYLTEIDVELVNAVAVQLAIALQKADLYTDLQDALHHEQMIRTQLVQSEKLTVAGRLLASVSHELNNPIQAIQNALFLLKNETNLSEQGRQDLEIVISEAERMSIMLQRLKVTYQPVSRQDFRPTPIQALVQEVFALLSTHLRHSRISYQVQAEPNLPPVLGVADQLKQVMLNLVMNAVDAMPDGGHITVSARHLPETAQVMLRVSDTGIGIDEAILPKIFDSFVTNKNGGSGLGLAITSDILRKHNGRIHAQNNPTGGATFSIWLPTQ